MKTTLMIITLLFFGVLTHAQTSQPSQDLKADSAAIKVTVLNYIEGYFNSDEKRMAKALDPELAKRIVFKDPSGDAVLGMGYSQLLVNTRRNKNANILVNNDAFKATVTIYDIGINIAEVKVTTNKLKFMDYLQLGRVNGEWKIINVLWENMSK